MIPQSEDDPIQVCKWFWHLIGWIANHSFRGSEHLATPMPGIGWEACSPLKDLVLIESVASVLPLFWEELEIPFFTNSSPFSANRREAILSYLEHFPFSFMLRFLMFPDLLLCFMFCF
jgi:hypothetical protein